MSGEGPWIDARAAPTPTDTIAAARLESRYTPGRQSSPSGWFVQPWRDPTLEAPM